jgi:hypothetical protein
MSLDAGLSYNPTVGQFRQVKTSSGSGFGSVNVGLLIGTAFAAVSVNLTDRNSPLLFVQAVGQTNGT